MRPRVTTIILNWNGKDHLECCLDSLLRTTYLNHHILLVDNASTDGSVEFVKARYPGVDVVVNDRNIGFARGNNVGFRHALKSGAEFVMLLNADTEVEPDWLDRLMEVMEADPRVGICGSKIMMFSQRGLISSFGHGMNLLGFAWDACVGRIDGDRWQEVHEVVSVCGAALLIRREALEAAGLFDPMYFAYYEDVDLALRVRMNGYTVKVAPASIVYHKYSAFFERQPLTKILLSKRNYYLFVLKFFPLRKIPWVFTRILGREWELFSENLRSGHYTYCRMRLRAILATLIRLPRLLWFRLRNRKPIPPSFWGLLKQRIDVPVNFGQELDYDPFEDPEGGRYPHRVIMGVSDGHLGMGWYNLDGEDGGRFRWIGRSAVCRLGVPEGEGLTLQVHVNCPYALVDVPNLKVFGNGRLLGEAPVLDRWQTHHFQVQRNGAADCEVRFEVDTIFEAELTHCIMDLGIMVHEISLLDCFSPFLRQPLPAEPLPVIYREGGRLPTSLTPGELKAAIRVTSHPERMYAHAEIPIEVELENLGDTVWLANPLPGGGHVALGLKLYDEEGKMVREAFPRFYLDRNIFPGQVDRVYVSVPPLHCHGNFRLKIDLVDEFIDWFENRGSAPFELPVELQ